MCLLLKIDTRREKECHKWINHSFLKILEQNTLTAKGLGNRFMEIVMVSVMINGRDNGLEIK